MLLPKSWIWGTTLDYEKNNSPNTLRVLLVGFTFMAITWNPYYFPDSQAKCLQTSVYWTLIDCIVTFYKKNFVVCFHFLMTQFALIHDELPNYNTLLIQKIRRRLAHDIRKHWTAVSTLSGLISSEYRDLHHWRLNQQSLSQNSTTEPLRTQLVPNKQVMVIAQPINLNVSCKLHPYYLQKTRSPPGPRLPRMIGNTHPRNYYILKGKNIDAHFLLKGEELYCELHSAFCGRWFNFQWGEITVYTAEET